MAVVVWSQDDVPLVGRLRELEMLRTTLAGASEGTPGAVLVAGEAGGGKTRLLRAFLDGLPPDPFVLRAQCVDLGDPGLPYLAMVDLVRTLQSRAAADAEVAAALDDFPVVTVLTDPTVTEDGAVDSSHRLQLFDALAALLGEVGRVRGPVVVAVEDLQWVDASSADFLRFLLSRMRAERLLLVATLRTDGLAARPRSRRLSSDLGRLPAVRRIDLQPFDADEVATYLAEVGDGDGDPALAAEIFRRTRGNPYYVQVLAAGVLESGSLNAAVPRAMGDLLAGRLDGVPDDVRTVVQCASVVAAPVPDRLLRRVVDLPEVATDEALRAAVAQGLLLPDGDGYAFAHDLLRAAVHDDLLPGERARLHAAYVVALETGVLGPARPAEVAHHAVQAQNPSKVLLWSTRAAADATRLLAPDEALHHLERALDAWPQVADAASLVDASEATVATRAAVAAGLAGEPMRAVEWARRAVRLSDDAGDGAGGVRARAELVRQLLVVDATDQAVRPAEEAVALAASAGVDAEALALAHVVLARALLATRRTAQARPQAARALAEARAAGAAGLEVEALATAAFLDEIDGDRQAAAEGLGEALRLARAEGELAAELRAHYALASLHYYDGDVGRSLSVLRTAMTRVTETGLRWSGSGVELRLLHAIALFVVGDLDGSLEVAEAPESRPPDVAAARLAAVSCYAAVALGRVDAGRRFDELRESWAVDPQVGLVAGGCEADHLTWAGEPGAAVVMAERAQTHLDTEAGEGMYGGLWLSALGLAALADEASSCRQRRDEAGTVTAVKRGDLLAERVERIVEGGYGRPGGLGPEGRAWQARALAEHARLRGEPAVGLWQAALDAFEYGHVYEQARCHWRLAEAYVAAGDRAAAREHAERAGAAAARMGAAPLTGAVAATVSRFRLSGATTAADAVLTGREREVLGLVAEGFTNREIGRRLYISEKTASVHISNLMAKLNVSSRTEAVTVAQRRGLLDVL